MKNNSVFVILLNLLLIADKYKRELLFVILFYYKNKEGVFIYNSQTDGLTHINIYSKGKTQLGKMLSNFYKFPINTSDGFFMSVEAYWYWLSIEDCKEKEILRNCYGANAKQTGKKLLETKNRRFDDDFERKILKAIWYKFRRNKNLIAPNFRDLPFEHYYEYGGKVIDVKEKYSWMIEGIEKMRKVLIEKQ